VALLKENASTLQLEAELANKVAENGVLAGRVAQLQEAVSKPNNQSKTREEYVKRMKDIQKAWNCFHIHSRFF
jgi:hypothetical protein